MASSHSLKARKAVFSHITQYYKKEYEKPKFIPGKTVIQAGGRVFDEKEMIAATDAVLDFWLTEGRYAKLFKEKLSRFIGVPNIVLTNSGSSANLLAFAALMSHRLGKRKLKPGDEVIGVGASFPATINPVLQLGCVPVLLDIDLDTLNINVAQLERSITKKTRAIFLAHSIGNPFNLDGVMKVARKHKLFVIEDCCDALGSKYRDKHVGSFGDISTFSFYPAHHITTGEGGAVATKDPLLHEIVVSLREWGREADPKTYKERFSGKAGRLAKDFDHRYVYTHAGYNLKITDIQPAIGVEQLKKFPQFIKRRRENFDILSKGLEPFAHYFILPKETPHAQTCWFGYPLTVKKEAPFSRMEIVKFLEGCRIETRMFFAGNITKQPYFENVHYRVATSLANTDFVMRNTFWFGVYPGITKPMVKYIIESFKSFLEKYPARQQI